MNEITTVAIVGTGVMGSKVAWACAVNGLDVYLYDVSGAQMESARLAIYRWLSSDEVPESERREVMARVYTAKSLKGAASRADLVFENVPEILSLKNEVHQQINDVSSPQTYVGTNASSLPISKMADQSGRPQRFFNMNFADPRDSQLVEVMFGPDTLLETKSAAINWARRIGMIPIVLKKEIMGYAFNRIWRAIKKECLFLADQEYIAFEDIDRAFMLSFNVPRGPFALMDEVGLHSVERVEEQYFFASGDESDKPPALLIDLVKRGEHGVSTGKGFYTYPDPAYEDPDWLTKTSEL